ncbi:MAG: hypothetical protein K2L31_01315, partial [Muribaculum sp.]|nr:hypothetical protein [Muribaculum sp.]
MKTYLHLIATLLCATHVSAQLTPAVITAPDTMAVAHTPALQSDDASYEMQFLPSVIPPTPQAAALARYGEYPVSHTTGIPDITIPLYEIDLGGYKLPITISYHASGFRPDDVATPVGLGWVLNAGGAVTRTIMGAPDFETGDMTLDTLYRNYNEVDRIVQDVKASGANMDKLESLALKGLFSTIDSESDRYTFNLPGQSGVFRYSHRDRRFIPLNHYPLRITHEGHRETLKFKIASSDGTIYHLDEQEWVGVNDDEGMPFTSAWLMTGVYTPHGNISFEYVRGERFDIKAHSKTHYAGIGYKYVPPTDHSWGNDERGHTGDCLESYTDYVYKQKLLSRITWAGGRIDFTYTPDRKDLCHERLTEIKVTANDGKVIKTIRFTNTAYIGDQEYPDHCRMLLEGVDDSVNGSYTFTYYNRTGKSLPTPLGYAERDYWGFYNGKTGSNELPNRVFRAIMTGYTGTISDSSGTDRWSDEELMKTGVLQSITHPTGAKTWFTYEANRWVETDGYTRKTQKVGGLRIKQISGGPRRLEYEYGDINRRYDPDALMMYKGKWTWQTNTGPVTHDVYVGMSSPMIPVGLGGAPASYLTVTEKSGDGTKTVYEYTHGKLNPVYEYPLMTDHPAMYLSALYDEGDDMPRLESRTVYEADGARVLTESFHYEGTGLHTFDIGVRIVCKYTSWTTSSGGFPLVWGYQEIDNYPDFLEYAPVTATAKAFNQVRKTVTDHVTGVVTEHTYTYDPQLRTLKPRSVAFTDSDGSRDSTRYEFPFDYTDKTSVFMAEYMPDAVLSVERFRDGARASRTETSYVQDNGKMWAFPVSVSTAYGDDTLQERERVLTRGAGNRPTAILVNTVDTTRIEWDKNGLYPLKVTAPGGLTTQYEWKPLTGVTMVTDPRGYKVAYGYDSAGRLSFIRDARDTLQTFSYSIINGPYGPQADNAVTTMRHINASGTRVMTRQYHDGLGRPTALAQGGLNTSGAYVYTMQTYDDAGRIADTWLPVEGTS